MFKRISQKQIQAIADKIAKEFKPEKIILFGSYAWGKPGPDSDIDLFIVKRTKDTRSTARKIDGFLWGRTVPLDIVVYTREGVTRSMKKGDFFIQDILSKGRRLYEER